MNALESSRYAGNMIDATVIDGNAINHLWATSKNHTAYYW
jgi:hypothetical protein